MNALFKSIMMKNKLYVGWAAEVHQICL